MTQPMVTNKVAGTAKTDDDKDVAVNASLEAELEETLQDALPNPWGGSLASPKGPLEDWKEIEKRFIYSYEDESKSVVMTEVVTDVKYYTRSFNIPEKSTLDDLADGIWHGQPLAGHMHAIENLTVEAHIHTHDVNWRTTQSPWSTYEIDEGSNTIEIHKSKGQNGKQLALPNF